MGRIKKRLARKKRLIKKVVRHVKKSESKTTEQQSRENEMIKTMLMRQQPALAGQTQQTDKLQQQLDTFNKTYNSAGWVFLDYRNNINELSKNTIIYAHGRLDTTMFGSLKNILSSGWINNTNNYVVKLSTETENTLWQVFSVYHIPTTNDYIKVNFYSNEEFNKWSSMLLNRSAHNFNTTINENDKILTLSTCYNDKEKVVLHAKLIKKETRY